MERAGRGRGGCRGSMATRMRRHVLGPGAHWVANHVEVALAGSKARHHGCVQHSRVDEALRPDTAPPRH